ncbi:hypothetical protein GGI20_002720 [Coemansia sp. BCRC 34301]|nr:hypothetical protein GGI20_002720 [Coemansia sp. BCRC 34301]
MFAGTRTLASVVAVFAALSLAVFQAAGVAINRDGSVHAAQNVADMTKELFLKYLDTKQSMLISFYGADSKESDKALSDFDEFARKAVKRYPDLQLGKVDFKQSPYLTARMLLTGAYNVEIPFDADEMVRYIDNQLWLDEAALGGKAQMYCSPFNFCGKALAFIADKSSAVEDVLPIPKWLALILIPAIITFAGRFIIDGMYGAEEWIRNFLGRPQTAKACDEPDLDSDPDEEEEEEHSAGRFKTPKKKTQ